MSGHPGFAVGNIIKNATNMPGPHPGMPSNQNAALSQMKKLLSSNAMATKDQYKGESYK